MYLDHHYDVERPHKLHILIKMRKTLAICHVFGTASQRSVISQYDDIIFQYASDCSMSRGTLAFMHCSNSLVVLGGVFAFNPPSPMTLLLL